MAISFVIFDMDGVLYDKRDGVRLRALSELSGRSPEEIDQAIFRSDFEAGAEAGHPATGVEYLDGFSRRLGVELDRETWIRIRRAMVAPKPRLFSLARRLMKHVDVAMLTNNPILLKETITECAPEVVALFGASAHVSAEFSARKPDAAVYHKICALHGHTPENTVMVDDSRRNVRGAIRAGLNGVLFTNPIALETELVRKGLRTGGRGPGALARHVRSPVRSTMGQRRTHPAPPSSQTARVAGPLANKL
ncbi:HAD-IA family hydrolase [Breoghania sp. L-A4]|uniref:HAD-IA family hydrolase n=1 Tax=Breoghania sp. L-A4 TaxID=2304600 RepID=UPI000E359B66|nr:HAD-IA family hydrolase [Breoghania sp. L-A4]AXS39486.1 HAD family phosphatase [Breoghania sp. L-A4]